MARAAARPQRNAYASGGCGVSGVVAAAFADASSRTPSCATVNAPPSTPPSAAPPPPPPAPPPLPPPPSGLGASVACVLPAVLRSAALVLRASRPSSAPARFARAALAFAAAPSSTSSRISAVVRMYMMRCLLRWISLSSASSSAATSSYRRHAHAHKYCQCTMGINAHTGAHLCQRNLQLLRDRVHSLAMATLLGIQGRARRAVHLTASNAVRSW